MPQFAVTYVLLLHFKPEPVYTFASEGLTCIERLFMTESRDQSLITEIQALIAERGGISFAEFMQQALYHPVYGYYMTARERIGRQGDFFTSSHVHSCFGRLIARQLEQMWQIMEKCPFTIAEQGAGDGYLANDILTAIAEEFPEFYNAVTYKIVEISSDGQMRQSALLAGHIETGRVEWCELPQLKGMIGCFLSNELVDAFPVHLVEKHGGELQEIFVVNGDGGFQEELRPLSTQELSAYFTELNIQIHEGNRCEVNLASRKWMTQVTEVLRKGFVLTIDYGYPAEELYAPWRHAGTLLCYQQHQTNDKPLQQVGLQDITAHVDFTTLQNVGSRRGLTPLYFGLQYQFLMGLGFVEMLIELEQREPDPTKAQALRMGLKTLIVPEGGMGDSFKVLIQGKHVGTPDLLCARKISDVSKALGLR